LILIYFLSVFYGADEGPACGIQIKGFCF